MYITEPAALIDLQIPAEHHTTSPQSPERRLQQLQRENHLSTVTIHSNAWRAPRDGSLIRSTSTWIWRDPENHTARWGETGHASRSWERRTHSLRARRWEVHQSENTRLFINILGLCEITFYFFLNSVFFRFKFSGLLFNGQIKFD